jgi:hypothetical protein
MYTHAWDETTQKVQSMLASVTPRSRARLRTMFMQVSHQIMVQQDTIIKAVCMSGPEGGSRSWHYDCEPWLCRPMVLKTADSNSILEGMVSNWGLHWDRGRMEFWCGGDAGIVVFAMDKASTHFVVVAWLLDYLMEIPACCPSCEPCGCHATQLGKNRCTSAAKTGNSLNSYARMMRQTKFLADLSRSSQQAVARRYKGAIVGPRPAEAVGGKIRILHVSAVQGRRDWRHLQVSRQAWQLS